MLYEIDPNLSQHGQSYWKVTLVTLTILGERRIYSKVYCIHLIPSDCADFLLQRKLCASSVEYPCKVQSVKKKE